MSNPSGQVIGWMLDYAAHEYLGELVVKLERLYSTFDSPYEGRDTCDKNLLLHCFHNILNHEEEFAKEDPMQIVQMFLQLHAEQDGDRKHRSHVHRLINEMSRQIILCKYIHHESTADKLKALVCALFPRKDSTSGGKKKRMRADDEMSKSRMDLLRFLASTNKTKKRMYLQRFPYSRFQKSMSQYLKDVVRPLVQPFLVRAIHEGDEKLDPISINNLFTQLNPEDEVQEDEEEELKEELEDEVEEEPDEELEEELEEEEEEEEPEEEEEKPEEEEEEPEEEEEELEEEEEEPQGEELVDEKDQNDLKVDEKDVNQQKQEERLEVDEDLPEEMLEVEELNGRVEVEIVENSTKGKVEDRQQNKAGKDVFAFSADGASDDIFESKKITYKARRSSKSPTQAAMSRKRRSSGSSVRKSHVKKKKVEKSHSSGENSQGSKAPARVTGRTIGGVKLKKGELIAVPSSEGYEESAVWIAKVIKIKRKKKIVEVQWFDGKELCQYTPCYGADDAPWTQEIPFTTHLISRRFKLDKNGYLPQRVKKEIQSDPFFKHWHHTAGDIHMSQSY
ncbi:hypothetical protein AAMO2058_000263500 [Amorphochlora amoebiformis]